LQEWADKHKTLIIVGVRDLAELLRWEQRLSAWRIEYGVFTEPDRGDEKTAIAVHPMAHPYLFRNLRLI